MIKKLENKKMKNDKYYQISSLPQMKWQFSIKFHGKLF